jgi:hypothetical protein
MTGFSRFQKFIILATFTVAFVMDGVPHWTV